MKNEELSTLEASFNQLVKNLLEKKNSDEEFTIKLSSERSQFIRFNNAKVRQTGVVNDGWIELTLMSNQRNSVYKIPFTGNCHVDWQQTYQAFKELREEVSQLPIDPYLVLPSGNNTSREIHSGNLLADKEVVSAVLEPVNKLDLNGLYAGGTVIQAYADSSGQKHWFSTDTFTFDYSLFNSCGQAVKGFVAGDEWHSQAYVAKITQATRQLELLSRPPKTLPKGHYKTYFAPAAVAEIVGMLSWGGLSEADIQQGNSALILLSRQERQFSPKFHMQENFRRGLLPRFNEWGEMAALELPLITNGVLVNTLINSRTAKEYQKTSNCANVSESLRAPEVSPGNLAFEQILPSLDTGLYVSNLHYLNWSDRPTGKITGMTRYACFWVEKGEIIAPIENLRFDDTLYSCWGDNLVDLTSFQEFVPQVGTYEARDLGGSMVPGMLVEDFTYTL